MEYRLNLKKLKDKYEELTGLALDNVEIVELLKKQNIHIYTQAFTTWQKKLPRIVKVLKGIEEVTGVSQNDFIESTIKKNNPINKAPYNTNKKSDTLSKQYLKNSSLFISKVNEMILNQYSLYEISKEMGFSTPDTVSRKVFKITSLSFPNYKNKVLLLSIDQYLKKGGDILKIYVDLNMSKAKIERIIKKTTGLSFNKYVDKITQ